ncbi:hypothetical protein O6H91_06G009400 [Diphasiastrum complanatum]|uniref:Uncharacterized protein n=2 Tax=Diphasiastrum complanatum TaxID=34168 RepID=A0ACC2DAY5_DIPCM|nr:hypothetical protein O6H91_06G008300 [Diphasiastrum complanatum]KAJ7551304.1 hypothetical protein O6H91_06G009400 [Diphasiastrum complanatum]
MGSDKIGLVEENGAASKVEEKEAEPTKVQNLERMKVLELGTLSTVPMALRAAIILDVFEIINKVSPTEPISAKDIVAHIPTTTTKSAVYLDRILKLLASREILSDTIVEVDGKKESRYGLTPLCKYLIKDEMGMSLAPLVVMNQDKVFMASWQYLPEAVLDGGEPFFKAHGKNAFQLGTEDPRLDKLFNTAMGSHSTLFMKATLDAYDGFKNISKLVDVGGGFGSSLNMIVSKYPHIQGINFDQPHVVALAPQYPGVEHVGGNMFESVPSGEAIFMKWILHDWSDDHCLTILKNCYKSVPDAGKVIVVDAVLPATVDHSLAAKVGYSVDLLMLAYNQGGKERTEEEFKDLALAAGFAGIKVICTIDSMSVLEFYKVLEL